MKEEYNISVIIPIIGEGKDLESLLKNLLSFHIGFMKEIIVSNGDKDEPLLGDLPRDIIRVISSPPGRGMQLNRGAKIATAPTQRFSI